tara:strand:- start:37 stop:561 length:525 start_codon:yes stop_codon:yes gene_type:complete
MDSVNLVLPLYKYSFPQLITKQVCKDYRKSFPQSNKTNVQAWHSNYNTHKTTNVFDPLIDVTLHMCYDISIGFFNCHIKKEGRFVVDSLWLAMYEKNDHTIIHHHFPFQFAACYYVDVNDDSSPITFGVNNDTVSIQPETGMLLIWNGIIPHMVAPTEKERTCICMNIGMEKIV